MQLTNAKGEPWSRHRPAVPGAGPSADAEAAARACAGDLAAFEMLYRQNVGRIHNLALRMARDRTMADDLTQEVFIATWRSLPKYRGDSAFSTWLYRLAVRAILKGCRARYRYGHVPVSGTPAYVQARPVDLRIDLERAIAALPVGARMVLVLHDIQGHRSDEVATMMGRAVGTVKSQLHRARKLLAEAIR